MDPNNLQDLIWGPWQKEIWETFGKATPILKKLSPKIDPRYILYLLRELTWIAMKWPDPEQREIERAWVALCRAVHGFLALSDKPSKELAEDLQNKKAAAEAAGVKVTYWPKVGDLKPSPELANALKTYSEIYSLPSYEEALEKKAGDKPDTFWSGAVALAMAEHFKEKTGITQRAKVAELMNCAPAMKYKRKKGPGENPVSMQKEDIRRRIVRWQRENKLSVRSKPTLDQMAYEFRRRYTKWVEAGAKGPCPSLIHSSIFRDPAFDTSLSDKKLTKLIRKLYKKYRPRE
ncbi:MAG: hypothetical protein HY694_16280 [Deltaproteobacteria bacterium]|nr:hypothetical protein [Deltaproteobacteria bacterium]